MKLNVKRTIKLTGTGSRDKFFLKAYTVKFLCMTNGIKICWLPFKEKINIRFLFSSWKTQTNSISVHVIVGHRQFLKQFPGSQTAFGTIARITGSFWYNFQDHRQQPLKRVLRVKVLNQNYQTFKRVLSFDPTPRQFFELRNGLGFGLLSS